MLIYEVAVLGKKKLTLDEQISDLEEKGVAFTKITKEDAKKFLKYNNYYFKLKHYARNYPINPRTKKYVNLDFAYLVELSKIDMHLRKIILDMVLDIEHLLKTRMLSHLCENSAEDGYNIIKKYTFAYPRTMSEISVTSESYSISSDLIDKHKDQEDFSLWNIVEVLSFGKFVELYTLYYQTYPAKNYSTYLGSIKFLRNAAAHNNCLIASLLIPNGTKKFKKTRQLTNALAEIKTLSKNARDKYMENPVIHDFVALLFLYNDLLKIGANRKMRDAKMLALKDLFFSANGNFLRHKDYFEKNLTLAETYRFVSNIIKYIDNQNHNPKHVNYLKLD